jgi:hypothetical protein
VRGRTVLPVLVSTLKEERRSSTCTDDYEVIFFCVAGAAHVDFLVSLNAK